MFLPCAEFLLYQTGFCAHIMRFVETGAPQEQSVSHVQHAGAVTDIVVLFSCNSGSAHLHRTLRASTETHSVLGHAGHTREISVF